jgi:high-affinity iron transporter
VGAAYVIGLREGIEAALIISILLAYLRQLGRSDRAPLIWWGTGIAVVLSVGVGAVIFAVGAEFEGRAEELYEGLVTLFAVSVLTWMIFWMRRESVRIKSHLQERVDVALRAGGLALAGLAFFAVLREGLETALFLFGADRAAAEGTSGTLTGLVGGFLGIATAAVLGFLLYRGGIRLNLRTFFRVTGILILIVAAGLFAFSVHELQEAGLLPFLDGTAYDVSASLPDDSGAGALLRALVGYNADPTVLEVLAWAAYLVVAGWYFLRPVRVPARTPASASTSSAR